MLALTALASLTALLPLPGGSPFWPFLGLWSVALVVVALYRGDEQNPVPGLASLVGLSLLAPLTLSLVGLSEVREGLQGLLLPVVAYLLSLITLLMREPRYCSEVLLVFAFIASCAFAAVSGLSLYYVDLLLGTDLLHGNAGLMMHLTSVLVGSAAMVLVLHYSSALVRLTEWGAAV